MDNDRFNPTTPPPLPEPPYSRRKNPYEEPPVKDFMPPKGNQQNKKHTAHKVVIGLIIVIILAGVGGGTYWQFFRHKNIATKTATQTTQKASTSTKTPTTIPTINYTSTGFAVAFSYPKGWTVTDDGATSVTILSPAMQLVSASGKTVSGKVVVIFQPTGQLPSSFGTTDAQAVLASQLVSYSNPTSDQAAQTYLSFVQYNSTTAAGALDGIYITGNYGYQKGQTIPRSDIASVDPLITVTFGQCVNTNCASINSLSIASTSWNSSSLNAPILTIIKSISFN